MNFSNENSSFLANSNSNIGVINSFSKYATLMDYLVKKLEARIKMFPKTRAAIANISNFQELVENKKEMIKHFFEVEDDLKQGVDAIKALLVQNRDLTEQLEYNTARANSQELKSNDDLNIINELNERNNDLIEECNLMRKKFGEIEEKSSYLREKISEFEDEFKTKEKFIEELTSENNSYSKEIERIADENVLLKMKIESLEKELKKINEKGDDREGNNENNVGNLNFIIAEKELNKKLIEEKVKTHFQNKSIYLEEKSKADYSSQPIKQNVSVPNVTSKSYFNISETGIIKSEESKVNHKNENLLSNIIMTVLESEENINLLNKRFGKDFMEKLLSGDVSKQFLKEIDEILKFKQISNKKDTDKLKDQKYEFDEDFNCMNTDESKKGMSIIPNNQNSNDDKIIAQENEERSEKYYNSENFIKNENLNSRSVELIKKNNFALNERDKKLSNSLTIPSHKRSNSSGMKFKPKKINFLNFPKRIDYKSYDSNINFKNNLRNYGVGRSLSTGKVFVNFTNPHSNYFDETLQKGGKSKLQNPVSKSK
jgi:hypothetical protein